MLEPKAGNIDAVYDYNSSIDDVIDYSEWEYSVPGKNDKYVGVNGIGDIDKKLSAYLKKVKQIIDNERSYGLKKGAFEFDGVDVRKMADDIEAKCSSIQSKWKGVKKKIELAVYKERKKQIEQIIESCRMERSPESYLIPRWMMSDKDSQLAYKTEKLEGYLDYTKKHIGELK